MRTAFPALLIAPALASSAIAENQALSLLMPKIEDHTSMWWAEGFPGVVEGAPWHRVIQTGNYAMVLDTDTLRIPHFGAVANARGYDAEWQDSEAWKNLPAADLALSITVAGKGYRCTAGGPWSRYDGPRLIESGRFFQRADVTDLEFTAADGTKLNVEARFETAAWADRLALILAARPGILPISADETTFGRVRGGFGLDGTNHFEIPADPKLATGKFTLEFWTFIPTDYKVTDISPWLVCKNRNELADGNYGILIRNGEVPEVRLNLGGGKENAYSLVPEPRLQLRKESWHHLAISYDGDTLRLYADGKMAAEKKIGRQRAPVPGGIAFGRRQDNSGDGYRFRGVVDEIRLYDRALTLEELRLHYVKPEAERPALKPIGEWTFREDIMASMTKLREEWKDAKMEISLSSPKGEMRQTWELPREQTWPGSDWHEVSLALDPVAFQAVDPASEVSVKAFEFGGNSERPIDYDATLGWHRVNLDGIEPIAPAGTDGPSNDALERVKLVLSNPADTEQVARLMFEKTARGFRQRIGTPITGTSAILRDSDGNPTGIPVQLSKNWHNEAEAGVYAGTWFHGISQVRLPANTKTEMELTIAYGHWGGVAAASHSQLSLIGWGSNQLWDQSALGSWGESLCFEPDQVQRENTLMDVRPVMVRSTGKNQQWGWTTNVGGGDIFRLFDPEGDRIPHSAMRTTYHRQSPCLTEVTYAGRIGEGIQHSATVSLARSDDIVRGTYRIRIDVGQPTEFSRFVIFQIGADTYSSTAERKMAIGDETGLIQEWDTEWGGDIYRTDPVAISGRIPWASLHDAVPSPNQKPGALANRGVIIRAWKAQLGGKEVSPWLAERGLDVSRIATSSTLDILQPPGLSRLEPGDFVEATIEHVLMPQFAKDYYGPNEALRTALTQNENTWRMVHREAVGNDRQVEMQTGTLEQTHPDIRVGTEDNAAAFTLSGGLGYMPVTFTGLNSHEGHQLLLDGEALDQSIHGKDFWQTDYDPTARTWSRTYNIPIVNGQEQEIQFLPKP